MLENKILRDAILPYTNQYGNGICACGVRYGSVLYMAFGHGLTKPHPGRLSTIEYSFELEVGSDRWVLVKFGNEILDSEFIDIELARDALNASLIGRKILNFDIAQSESIIIFDGNLILNSTITPDPASGFLYSFGPRDGPVWETVDGVLLQT